MDIGERKCDYLLQLEKQLIEEYNLILWQKENFLLQKSRIKCLTEWNKNTHFFHTITVIRRLKGCITCLKDENDYWMDNQETLQQVSRQFYINLYTEGQEDRGSNFSFKFPQSSRSNILLLNRPLSHLEVLEAIIEMGGMKVPGPNRLSLCFFQKNWDIIGAAVTESITDAFARGSFSKKMNGTLLTLVPKQASLETMSHIRPIALCNFVAKAITKIISNRLKNLMHLLMGEGQASFIPRRQVVDNVIIIQEVLYSMKRKAGLKRVLE